MGEGTGADKAYKGTVIEVVVISLVGDAVGGTALRDVAGEADEGSWVASKRVVSETPLDRTEAIVALEACGSDESFLACMG